MLIQIYHLTYDANPGYINILGRNKFAGIVFELKVSLTTQAAASFKHTSPAEQFIEIYQMKKKTIKYGDNLSNIAQTYIKEM